MKNQEIQKHEILKQAALYSYDVNKNKIPKLLFMPTMDKIQKFQKGIL